MMKATTIKADSCSRPARPQKALGACAQVSPSSTVSPKREEGRLVADFKSGMSIYQVATKYSLDVLSTEEIIRRAMKGAL